MAIFEWRKFNFFDLNKGVDNGKVSATLKEATITCSSSGNNQIILCDSLGYVHIFQRTWESITFKAYEDSICLCQLSSQHNLLVTVGTDENGSIPSFKVWNITKTTKSGLSSLLRTVKIALQKPTALAVSDNGQYMAIGFDLGSISLYRGDINRDRSKTLKTLSGGTTSITGIAFKQNEKITQMFVCSDSGVLVYNLQIKDKEPRTILDATCEPTRCCAVSNESHFMVGRDNAVYCYTVDGRGPCYVLEGQKSIIEWFRSHLITISKSIKSTMSSSTQKDSMLTVIDIQNKFIVFTSPIDRTVAILIEFGTCFIITIDNEVYHLDEKDLQSKLMLLFKKNLYDIAVRIAKNSQYDTEGLAEIFKQYGDHMYSKGDFASAVEQYTKTIGYLEPSYVIRRFLDSRHIHYLTDYLQAVHKQGQATADHTTLLLNCFTRLDRTDQLKEFLRNDKNPDIAFDLDVAIKVCRSTSVENALSLAKRNQKHDLCLSILIEDMFAYKDALEYLSNLTFLDAEENLKKYGNILMAKCPDEITELLKKLCTNYRNLSNSSNISNNFSNSQSIDILIDTNNSHVDRANPEDFIHLFVKSPERLINFLEHLIANLTNCSQLVYNTLIEHYLYQWKIDKNIETRLMEILQNNEEIYDRNHALILCSAYGFTPGIMLIYEEQKLYHLIVRYHLKNGDYNSLLDCCTRLGSSQPSLWLQTLTGLRNDKIAPTNLLSQILQVIAQEKLQSPLQVLNCLAVENGPNLLNVREYFLQVFQKENESTKQEEELVTKYRNDSITLKNHIKNLREHPIEFKSTLCNTCHQALSMPALYFLCKHSYHQDCVRGYSDNDKDCQVCHSKNLQLIDALRAQSESREQHEIFHNLLDRSSEPFSVVTEYFGRGLFNKIVIVDEDSDSLIRLNDINRNNQKVIQLQQTTSQAKSITTTTATTTTSTASTTPPTVATQHIKQITNQLPSTSASTPYNAYGTGTEAKIRIEEGLLKGRSKDIINRIPIPEGRMRLNESKYSTSLEANIIRPAASSSSLASDKSPKNTPMGSPKTKNTIWLKRNVGSRAGQKVSKNPFGDENNDDDEEGSVDDGHQTNQNNYNSDIGYDEKKNPFADDFENDSKLKKQIKEYDNSLNPFA